MHPIERLRYVARAYECDPGLLAQEAADALWSLANDPMTLVTSARRLIQSHPDCGPLWWVAAQLLSTDDFAACARKVIEELSVDPTSEVLAGALPGCAHVIATSSPAIADACAARPDISVEVFGTDVFRTHDLWSSSNLFDESVSRGDVGLAMSDASLVIVEALAVSTGGFVFRQGDAEIVDAAAHSEVPCWVVAGVGRILPEALFNACLFLLDLPTSVDPAGQIGDSVEDDPSEIDATIRSNRYAFRYVERAEAVASPLGVFEPTINSLRADCPAPGELCRWR